MSGLLNGFCNLQLTVRFFYALTGAKASVPLPQVVKLEVMNVLQELAEKGRQYYWTGSIAVTSTYRTKPVV